MVHSKSDQDISGYNAEFEVFLYFYGESVFSIISIFFNEIFILQGFKVYEDLYEELVLRLKENPCTPKAPDLPNPCQANTILYFCIFEFVFAHQKHQKYPIHASQTSVVFFG